MTRTPWLESSESECGTSIGALEMMQETTRTPRHSWQPPRGGPSVERSAHRPLVAWRLRLRGSSDVMGVPSLWPLISFLLRIAATLFTLLLARLAYLYYVRDHLRLPLTPHSSAVGRFIRALRTYRNLRVRSQC